MIHPAMDAEAIRRVAEAHHVAGAAMYRLADAIKEMGDITQPVEPKPAPAAEPEPGEWRNDRAPKECEADDKSRVWVWQPGASELVGLGLASFWYESCPARNYWAPGNQPKPTSPPLVSMTDGHGAKLGPAPKSLPPDVVGSQEVELEPGEWQDDGPPTDEDEGILGCVWCFRGGQPALTNAGEVRLLYAHRCCQWWAPGNRPAPTTTPRDVVVGRLARAGAEPFKSPTNGWIVDRPPTRKDADIYGFILVPDREDAGAKQIHLDYVHPGTPWARTNSRLYPWDPTCLDRNSWIRSRLPTVEDAGHTGHVLIPVGHGGTTSTISYHLIVPGQPWAPWGSNPGRFEK